jgi:hypothetical protein
LNAINHLRPDNGPRQFVTKLYKQNIKTEHVTYH